MSKIIELGINLSMLTSGNLNTELPKAAKSMQTLKQSMTALQGQSEKLTAFQQLGERIQNNTKLKNEQDILLRIASGRQQQVKALREQLKFDKRSALARGDKSAAAAAQRNITFMTREIKSLETEQDRLFSSTTKLNGAIKEDSETFAKMKSELAGSGINVENLASSQARLTSQIERQKSAMERLQSAQAKYNSIREQLFNWNNIKADFMQSAALIKTFEKPIRVNMEFSQAMANVQAVLNVPDEEFRKLENQSMKLGAETQFTSTQAANTQENLARAGFNTEQIINTMPAVLTMAAADGLDLAQSGSIMSKTLSQFELDSTQAQRVADVLAMTSASSNTNIANIGEGMIKLAPVARLLGVSLEQAAAMLGSIANNYQDGSEGGTAVARILQRLAVRENIKGTGKKGDVLNGLNVVIKKNGQLRQVDEILTDLNSQMDKLKMSEKQRAVVYEELFGKQYMAAASALTSQSVQGTYKNLENKITYERDGKAQSMAGIRNNTLQGDITTLGSAWEGLMIRIGKSLEPVSRFITQTLTQAITKINNIITSAGPLADIIINVAAAAAGLKIFMTVYKYAKLSVGLVTSFLELKSAIGGVSIFTKAASAAQWLWNAALNANPIGLTITAIAGLIALGTLLYKNWDTIKNLGVQMWGWIQQKAQEFNAWWESWTLSDIFAPIVQYAWQLWEDIKAPFIAMKDWIYDLFASLNPFANYTPSAELLEAQKHPAPDPRTQGTNHRARAMGGMITRPEIALIGEAGPEAIIPLSPGKKSRGLQVLSMAADSLGVNLMPANNQVMTSHINNSQLSTLNDINNNQTTNYTSLNSDALTGPSVIPYEGVNNNTQSFNMTPTINININSSGENLSQDMGRGIADNIYDRVKEALSEIMNNESRLSFA